MTPVLDFLQPEITFPDAVGWTFRLQEESLVTGTCQERCYLFTRKISIECLSVIQTDIEYLNRICGIPCNGVALVSEDDWFAILDLLAQEKNQVDPSRVTDVQKRLEGILTHAVNLGASDLHITRRDNLASLDYRINGVLVQGEQMLSRQCDELIFVLYNVQASTRETTWNRSIPQSANILYTLDGRKYRFRYAHFPVFGETDACYHAVLRIIPAGVKKSGMTDLADTGISPGEVNDVRRILSNPYGAYFIAGTTGSGKSTTMKIMMEWLQRNRFDNKGCFLTVEDPVEYQIAGARQSSVLDADGGGFHVAIKSALRRDPDVLMVGEIRDPVSANALAGAVESGHYCFTTVHAGNIVTLLQRLSALGIGSDKLSTPGFIAGLQCQKLLPVLCDQCKQARHNVLLGGRTFDVYEQSGTGCDNCNYTGISSRQLIVEYMRPGSNELESISRQAWFQTYQFWRSKRQVVDGLTEGFDLREKAAAQVLAGRVCINWFTMEFGDVDPGDMEVLIEKIH